MTHRTLLFKGLLVVALGAVSLIRPDPVTAATSAQMDGFCVRCVDSSGCGLEEELCVAWGCGQVGQATCGSFGTCNGENGKRLVVCNGGDES